MLGMKEETGKIVHVESGKRRSATDRPATDNSNHTETALRVRV